MSKKISILLKNSSFILCLFILFSQCKNEPTIKLNEQDIATKWAEMTMHITQHTPANSPTFASRCLGYIGLTMYESIVHGYEEYNSLAGQLNELDKLPLPESEKEYNWHLALNAGQAEILRSIYIQTADTNKVMIDSLERLILNSVLVEISDNQIAERSVAYGKSIAQSIFEWSKTDGGHRGYLKNFDKNMVHPNFLGSWKHHFILNLLVTIHYIRIGAKIELF